MTTLHLTRVSTDTEVGTFGVLQWADARAPFAVTLENPWFDNERNVSCIPDGRYGCEHVDSPRFGSTWEVANVPDRTHILFHKGNTHVHTQGCILVGEQFTFLDGIPGVGASAAGFNEFHTRAFRLGRFQLEIRWAFQE